MLSTSIRNYLAPVLASACLLLGSSAFASPVEYQITGIGSGSIGGVAFNNQVFDIVMFGDTAASSNIIDPLASAQLVVAGFAPTAFSIPTRLGLANAGSVVFFSRAGNGGLDLFDFNLTTAVPNLNGPFSVVGTGVFALNQFVNVASSMGAINFNSSSDVMFSAAPVPEPETYGMMLAGLGLVGFVLRRKQSV